jgi:site-specific recombinase XerD
MSTIVLHPDEEHLNARQLTALIDRWLESLDVVEVTLTTYRGKIKHFSAWWASEGPRREWRLTKTALREFEVHLRGVETKRFGAPLSYNSRYAIMRALRMMFKWSAATGRTSKNYGEWVPWPSGGPPVRRSANVEHLALLMLAAMESKQALRDQAIIAFFIGTGCRLGEVAGLNVADIQILADGSGRAMVTGKRTSGNDSGERAIAFDGVTGRYLIRYMDVLMVHFGPLWIDDRGDKISDRGIYQMIKRTVKRAGLEEYIKGCHDFRRAFATILGLMHPDSPAWADMIRRQLGHKHYAMTAHYTLLDVDDIRDRITSPLAQKQIE